MTRPQVAMKEACPVCRALVLLGDLSLHLAWHRTLTNQPSR